ncbi:LysR family transcriptional regulator [Sulfitobacter donghicola]|uniref:LysR family transcriptional regulator n=1 Tax=Sulfitobacter donghicola DSW-25 = KCTC 12864 = JCM 14565 TaxID=1300350 RepID=A0A073IWT3_9RHOB|nr:LysR family transcriptional regulator [Sulfitobacter donghicola]KEJ89847.1 LysR family transcriptional regulator [Sulfitobacter donghicola DSW-25 = KCTC 12864 = JCM 14565]KIN67032.1 Transcriptional regulator, LysR family protein [Sulfitobacter donghicola DSW-25 = KCTC 12864 = JCM 14565]
MNTKDIPWHLLQSFAAIGETGSLSAAAVRLGSSQPTLSRHLNQLEEQLGTRLFFRTPSGLTLTPEGASVRRYADEMAQSAAQLSISATGPHDLNGTVRITASQIAATYLLPPMLTALHIAYPGLSLELVASDETDNLLRREADLAVRMYRPTQDDLISKMVAELPLGIYASRGYLEKHGTPGGPEDLERHTVIGYDRNTLIIDGMKRVGLHVDRSFFKLRSDDQVVCWQMVLAGMGIGFGQQCMAADNPDLVQLWPEIPIGHLPVWLTAHQELRMSPRVRACFDHLAQSFSQI